MKSRERGRERERARERERTSLLQRATGNAQGATRRSHGVKGREEKEKKKEKKKEKLQSQMTNLEDTKRGHRERMTKDSPTKKVLDRQAQENRTWEGDDSIFRNWIVSQWVETVLFSEKCHICTFRR